MKNLIYFFNFPCTFSIYKLRKKERERIENGKMVKIIINLLTNYGIIAKN